MGLIQMSLYGAVMILAVALIRTVMVNYLPKRTFIVLWCVAMARLLIPFNISSDYSVYSMIGYDVADLVKGQTVTGITDAVEKDIMSGTKAVDQTGQQSWRRQLPEMPQNDGSAQTAGGGGDAAGSAAGSKAEQSTDGETKTTWFDALGSRISGGMTDVVKGTDRSTSILVRIIYGAGAVLFAVWFIAAYVRCRIEFGMSLPVTDDYVRQWMEERCGTGHGDGIMRRSGGRRPHRLRNGVTVRVSDRIDTPLTYGVIRPVILLPKKTAWEQREQVNYVLWHEYMHICRGDSVLKLFAAAALCVHWFNPFVWGMYFLLNRDIELACDESVVHRCGIDGRSAYANMLIAMEAKKSGLVPFGSNFSQNAIEERVRAIMKIRKISIGAVIFAVGIVTGVTTAFATSAGSKYGTVNGTGAEDSAYTRKEWDMLSALQFDGYEDMPVSEFQDRIWTLTDTVQYRGLLERMGKDEAMYGMRGMDDMADFFYNVLEPLTGERWQERYFSGSVSVSGRDHPQENTAYDMAVLEYVMKLSILDVDTLTVGGYTDARLETADRISNMMLDYTAEELADEDWMQEEIARRLHDLTAELGTEAFRIDVEEWFYQPLTSLYADGGYENTGEAYPDYAEAGYYQSPEEYERSLEAEEQALHDAVQEEIQEELASVLKPYQPFGLTYEYDVQAEDFKMYFEGREVRGIIDEKQGVFVSAPTGISTYAQDAIELYSVYDEEGNLTGLRAATEEEQEEWNLRRTQSTAEVRGMSEEVREFPPGTSEDYDKILSLKKVNYNKMPLADFNSALLDWANAHSDSYDRIECDRSWNDFRVNLSKEDKEFVTCTIGLSGLENAMMIRSLYRGKSEEEAEDVSIEDVLTKDPGEEASQYTWCQMYYSFSYHVSDKKKVTVGERDLAVGGMLDGIEDFWEQTDIEELLKMEKRDIIEKLDDLAAKHSTRNVKITVAEDDRIGFECMDERILSQ